MKVKICGQTSLADSAMSIRAGADFIGVVLDVPWSKRSLNLQAALPIFQEYGNRSFLLTFDKVVDRAMVEIVSTLDPYALQLTGREPAEDIRKIKELTGKPVFKSIHMPAANGGSVDERSLCRRIEDYEKSGADGFILDTATNGMYGGTGVRSDWAAAARIIEQVHAPVFLAGGINPDNVAEALKVPGIYGIDLASGVESSKGVKSGEKLLSLFEAVKIAGTRSRF